jgi:hypothetical protein
MQGHNYNRTADVVDVKKKKNVCGKITNTILLEIHSKFKSYISLFKSLLQVKNKKRRKYIKVLRKATIKLKYATI